MADKNLENRHLNTLDRDLGRFSSINNAILSSTHPLANLIISLIFIIVSGAVAMLFMFISSFLIGAA